MKTRQHIVICSHCGEKTIPREESVFEGWTKIGVNRFCSLCGGKLDGSETAVPASETVLENFSQETVRPDNAFVKLFGDEKISVTDPASILGTSQETVKATEYLDEQPRFCRDCKEYIKHPFHSRCGKTNREVGPMDDCPDFTPAANLQSDTHEGTSEQ